MAGWTCWDDEVIEWDGSIKAKKFKGDGSGLSGISGTKHTIQDNGTPMTARANLNFIGAVVSDNLGSDATEITVSESDPLFIAASSAIWTAINNSPVSSAVWSAVNNVTTSYSLLEPNYKATSAAYVAHAADSSDPHGLYLTQTSFAITGDQSAASQAYVLNTVFASTVASGAVAANYPIGTIYVLYVA